MNKATMKLLCTITLVIIAVTSYGQCQWDRFKKATDETTPEGQALTEAIDQDPAIVDDWEKLDIAGIRDMQVGYGKALDKEKWLADLKVGIYKNGNKAEYANSSGNLLKWTDQHPSSINQSINSALQSSDPGKLIEGKVGDFVRSQGKEVEGFGLKIDNSTLGGQAGDIDVLTKNEIIEVKKSYSAWSSKPDQMVKFIDPTNAQYLNPHGRVPVLYIDQPLTAVQKADILAKIPSEITLVNSLDELKSILQ